MTDFSRMTVTEADAYFRARAEALAKNPRPAMAAFHARLARAAAAKGNHALAAEANAMAVRTAPDADRGR